MMILVTTLVLKFLFMLRFPSGSPTTTIIAQRYGNYALKVYRRFQKCSFKENKINLDLNFLNVCLKNKLIPKFLRFKLWKHDKDNKKAYDFQKKKTMHICKYVNLNINVYTYITYLCVNPSIFTSCVNMLIEALPNP